MLLEFVCKGLLDRLNRLINNYFLVKHQSIFGVSERSQDACHCSPKWPPSPDVHVAGYGLQFQDSSPPTCIEFNIAFNGWQFKFSFV